MTRRAALLPTSLLFTLAACVGGEKDPADGDSTGDGADGAADGGAADGGADGGGGGTVRAQARVQLRVSLPDGSTTPLVGAAVALAAEGPPADGAYPCVDDDLDGVVSCAAEVDARATSLVACWRSPEGAEGCAEPVPFDGAVAAASRAEEGTGRIAPVDIAPEIVAPDTAIWGRLTMADGFRTYSCAGQPELCTDRPTVSVRGPDGGESPAVPVGQRGDYLLGLSGAARPAEATLAVEIGESGPLTAYPAPAGGEQALMLNEPALQLWAEVLEIDAGTVRIGLRAETRALGREGVVRGEAPLSELRVVATPNWRGSAELTEEGVLWSADPEAASQSLKVCAARGYATACAPVVRLLSDGAGGLRLAADSPTQAYAAVGPDGEPVEGARVTVPGNAKDLFLAREADDQGEAYLDGPVTPRSVWAWAPGHAAGMIYDEGGEPGMRAEATPIRLVPTYTDADLVATDVRGGINYATADGRLSFTLPTDSLMDDAGIVRRPYKVRLAVVDPGETHPTPLDIMGRELSVLTPKISVYIGFEEEDGRPIVAQFNGEVARPTLTAKFADGATLPEKKPSFNLQPSDRSSWVQDAAMADPAGGGFNLTIPKPGWWIVAEPYDPGHCISVYVDEQAGYDTLWATWTDPSSSATGSTAVRIRGNRVLLYNLPDWADVEVTLGNKYGPDEGMPEASATLRASAPGRRRSLYDEPMGDMEDCPSVTLPTVPVLPSDDHFFTKTRLEDYSSGSVTVTADQLAQDYYDTIDPSGLSTTLSDWKANACGWPAGPGDANATYQNLGDLGFVRDMYSYTDPATGTVCMYVTNYLSFAAWAAGAPIATVAMEWSAAPGVTSPTAQKYTKFYVFSADGDTRLLRADLDGNGDRAVPHLCMNCHGGDDLSEGDLAANGWPNQGDVGARFLPFDPAAYGYLHSIVPGVPSGLTRADLEDDLRALNEDVLTTSADPETRSLIHLWYGSTATSSNTLPAVAANPHAVPTAWGGSPTDREAWVEVIQPRCLLCHMSLNDNYDWDAPAELAGWGNYIHTLVSESREMPHARRPFQNLYSSQRPHETDVLEDFFYARGSWTDFSTGDPLECSF